MDDENNSKTLLMDVLAVALYKFSEADKEANVSKEFSNFKLSFVSMAGMFVICATDWLK